MKNLLKKLHIGSNNQSGDSQGSANSSSKGNTRIRLSDGSPSDNRLVQSKSDYSNKPLAAISGWLNSVTNRNSNSSPPSLRAERMEPSDSVGSSSLDAALDVVNRDSGSSRDRDRDVEEEYQIQMALEMSAREDPEAVQIEAVKQISLGSCPSDNTQAEIVSYRYWVRLAIFIFSHYSLALCCLFRSA